MPLFIKDDAVDDLAKQYQKLIGADTKTEAVRDSLRKSLEALKQEKTLTERIAAIQDKADALGPSDPDFNLKKFTDEMWGDL